LRKYVFIALSVFLLLTFAAFVYAEEPQIKLGGRIMVRGWYFSNAAFATNGADEDTRISTNAYPGDVLAVDTVTGVISKREPDDAALWTSNISLTVDAKVADNVQGFLELEVANNENVQSGLYVWGQGGGTSGTTSPLQGYDAKPNADMRLRQAWIQYTGSGLLGVPAGIKVGHQLITLGEKQFLNHERFGDDALVIFVNPTNETTLAAATAKLYEGIYTLPGDDIDAYVLMGTYKVNKDNTIGAYYFYANNSDMEATAGYAGFDGLSLQDVGFHANGMLAGIIDYALEVDGQFGKVKGFDDSPQHADSDDLKYRGYAVYLRGGYNIPETPLKLRASFAYGSGDENAGDEEDGKIKEFQACQGFDTEVNIARFVHYTQIYERTIATAALIQTVGGSGAIFGPHRNTGIANTTYYNLGVDLAATKDLSMSLDGYILRATKTGGWAEYLEKDSVSKNVGWELDFKSSYKLAKNLTYFVEAGVFKPGKFYEDTGMVETKRTVSQVVHGLNLTF
jgi:hypothetical protein